MKSFREKLAICVLTVGSFVGGAHAAQVIVFEAPLDNRNQEVSAVFAANRDLGRAWVDVQLDAYSGSEGLPGRDVISRLVEGLYYDSARKQVLYRTASDIIVCAEDATFLGSTYLKSTGQCLLTPRTEQRKIDDGFRIRERTVVKVIFDAQTSTASGRAGASNEMTRETTVGK